MLTNWDNSKFNKQIKKIEDILENQINSYTKRNSKVSKYFGKPNKAIGGIKSQLKNQIFFYNRYQQSF